MSPGANRQLKPARPSPEDRNNFLGHTPGLPLLKRRSQPAQASATRHEGCLPPSDSARSILRQGQQIATKFRQESSELVYLSTISRQQVALPDCNSSSVTVL